LLDKSFKLSLLLFWAVSVPADILDYKYQYQTPTFSSYGTVGLIQMPSARLLESGSLAFTYSNFDPYARIAMVAYPFSWLEMYYQYTDISNKLYSDVFAYSKNQTYKDKGFDIKIKLLDESQTLPALALGFRDLAGTGLFSSEFLVASKQFNNFDFTLGLGWGNLSDNTLKNPLTRISKKFESRAGFQEEGGMGGEISTSSFFRGKKIGAFGGIQYQVPFTQGMQLKIEYDSTNYDDEGFYSLDPESNINYGLAYALNKNIKINFGYIRGNKFQFGFSVSGNFGKKSRALIRSEQHVPIKRSDVARKVNATRTRLLYLSTLKNLNDRDLHPKRMDLNESGTKFSVSFAQNKFLSYPQAYGRVLKVLNELAPDSVTEFELIPVNAGMELITINVPRKEFASNLKLKNSYYPSEKILISKNQTDYTNSFSFQPKVSYPATFFTAGPSIQTHIGGPSRFFIGGLNFRAKFEALFTSNTNLQVVARVGLINSFDSIKQQSDSVLPHVRTDVARYLREGQELSFPRFQFNDFRNPMKSIYTKFSMGMFEEMFGGYGSEFLYRPFDKSWAIGMEAYRVRQRNYKQRFKFHKNGSAVDQYETSTGHLTFYFEDPKTQVLFKLSGGRYLAGDSGYTVDMSRRFKSGLRMGGYFTLTDISKEEYGEGSFDKGFYVHFPLSIFLRNHSRVILPFGMTPLTRDGGARLLVGFDLYGVTDQSSTQHFLRDKYDLYE
jgi:hypothetical protein